MNTILQVDLAQVRDMVHLFDGYRIFYGQQSNIHAATLFLNERIKNQESIIFTSYIDGKAVGFVQLYFTFSSVSLEPSLILNDLYVDPIFRNKNIGKDLLLKAQEYCTSHNYKGLALETAVDNPAQKLYEKLGWKKDSHCFHYFWSVK
ncbi:GNAT family N-acetyltransferase [Maribacter confluentis]|uniref:Acetyltransferase (GNAT) family protein n=2 Tax=Maribacter TaxID=252356 RepID=A0ABY1SGZ7_9FLAO|nr:MULTISPECIES: GNAT family N-acetyltransferase [Maribacter]MDO1511284.1 GNAT family N-acetyltransferase [Maribacter confluentis]SNR43742.1 Acetyltransferase (GNAT) family protein [Maribacter sedimenticola]